MARALSNAYGDTVVGAHLQGVVTPESMFQLGLDYAVGRDCEVDLVQAHKWFNLASARGHQMARRYRTELAMEMSRKDVAKAQSMAREWLGGR